MSPVSSLSAEARSSQVASALGELAPTALQIYIERENAIPELQTSISQIEQAGCHAYWLEVNGYNRDGLRSLLFSVERLGHTCQRAQKGKADYEADVMSFAAMEWRLAKFTDQLTDLNIAVNSEMSYLLNPPHVGAPELENSQTLSIETLSTCSSLDQAISIELENSTALREELSCKIMKKCASYDLAGAVADLELLLSCPGPGDANDLFLIRFIKDEIDKHDLATTLNTNGMEMAHNGIIASGVENVIIAS